MRGKKTVSFILAIAALELGVLSAAPTFAASLVATWEFNNTFAADQGGAPALTPVDPEGTSNFHTDTVYGNPRTVWAFNGSASPTSDQAGLTVSTTGLVDPEHYSVYFIAELTQRDGNWRRLLDVQNRASDNGFYVNPSNDLEIYPTAGSSAAWTNDTYHSIVLTVDGTAVNAYLDGVSQFTTTTSIMDLDYDAANNPNALLGFFLDNTGGGGTGEWSEGNIALAELYDGALSATDAQDLASHPFPAAVPQPAAVYGGLLLIAGVAGSKLRKRRLI